MAMSNDIDELKEEVYMLRKTLYGNGDASQAVMVRLDRAERTIAKASWVVYAVLGATIANVIGLIFNLLSN